MTSSADESAEIVNAWEAICWPNFKTAPIKDEALDQLRREIAAALDRVSGQALERAAKVAERVPMDRPTARAVVAAILGVARGE